MFVCVWQYVDLKVCQNKKRAQKQQEEGISMHFKVSLAGCMTCIPSKKQTLAEVVIRNMQNKIADRS